MYRILRVKSSKKQLKLYKNGQTSGRYQITSEMLKYLGRKGLTEVLNRAMNGTNVSDYWGTGIIYYSSLREELKQNEVTVHALPY